MFLVNFSCHHLEDDGTVFLWTFLSKGEYVLLWSVRPKLVYLHYLWKTSKNEEQQKRSKWRITCNHSLQEMTGFYDIWQITWISEVRDGSTEGNNPPSPPPLPCPPISASPPRAPAPRLSERWRQEYSHRDGKLNVQRNRATRGMCSDADIWQRATKRLVRTQIVPQQSPLTKTTSPDTHTQRCRTPLQYMSFKRYHKILEYLGKRADAKLKSFKRSHIENLG